jgi:hypothetical protein
MHLGEDALFLFPEDDPYWSVALDHGEWRMRELTFGT